MDKADDCSETPDFDDIWENRIKDNDEVTDLVDTLKRMFRAQHKEMSSDEIEEMAFQSAYDDMKDRYDEIEGILFSYGKDITIYREICVKDYKEFLSELSECSDVGIFWATDEGHAISYWGHDDDGIVLVGRVSCSEIDVVKTVTSFIENQDEYEIRLKEGVPVFISEAIIRHGCGDRFDKKDIDRVTINKRVLS